jgi:hypothetical protein
MEPAVKESGSGGSSVVPGNGQEPAVSLSSSATKHTAKKQLTNDGGKAKAPSGVEMSVAVDAKNKEGKLPVHHAKPTHSVKSSKESPSAASPVSDKSVTAALSASTQATKDSESVDKSGGGGGGAEEEYRAKLAEKRRLAREKAEREAAEAELLQKRLRQEAEEKRIREEEEARLREEEELKAAEESRKVEMERLQRAMEEEGRRRRDELEQLEVDRKQRQEAERLAREEAVRLEEERQARFRREEEEKQERKKRLELIMKRVKPDDSSTKVDSANGKSQPLSADMSQPAEDGATPLLTAAPVAADITLPQFKSARLQQLLAVKLAAGKTADAQTPTDNGGGLHEPENGNTEETKNSSSVPPIEPDNGSQTTVVTPSDGNTLTNNDCLSEAQNGGGSHKPQNGHLLVDVDNVSVTDIDLLTSLPVDNVIMPRILQEHSLI